MVLRVDTVWSHGTKGGHCIWSHGTKVDTVYGPMVLSYLRVDIVWYYVVV